MGAFFIGKKFGKRKLSELSSAAGAASPNKTIEGAVGGIIASIICSAIGAKAMRWKVWWAGPSYGLLLSFFGLIGDLSVSLIKREAKLKDSGDLLPGHGGILDRIDSYMITAPIAFVFYGFLYGHIL